MYRFTLLLICSCIIAACSKSKSDTDYDDLSGDGIISGKTIIRNWRDGEKDIPFTNDSVYIKKTEDITVNGFLYSVQSDGSGYFTFSSLHPQQYTLFAQTRRNTRLDTEILFTGRKNITATSTSVQLLIEPDTLTQNGLYITCKDAAGGTLPGDSVYLYTSRQLAINDSAAIAGIGASYRFTTRADGTAFKMNLPAGKMLYLNAANTFGNLRLIKRLDSVQIDSVGVKPKDVIMQ